ncbi:HAMP domain-containing histidine kinase [Candidatus Saccharibacteria bacterium]|nr:HAMP domain-containing histidine kinase [Candidatus Saccharibacteria bacterium]
MFKNLRNKFILINLALTTFVLAVSYSAIYLIVRNSADNRKPIPAEITISESSGENEVYFRQLIEERVMADRKLAMRNLLIVLIITGISVEACIFVFSFFFAEEAIKPVKNAYETQKIFIANASHEIKTPVAAIKANLEAVDLSEENHWIKNIEIEADKIESLNLALLKLAKTDAISEPITQKTVKLRPLVEKNIKSFESRLRQGSIALKTDYKIDKDSSLKLNSDDFQEIFSILFDNAIKYCKKSIEIKLTGKTLRVKNDGATIPKEKLPHVFDRFYQVDKSASGSGLGLAIAASLSKRNNWHLSADSDSSSTSFTLTF